MCVTQSLSKSIKYDLKTEFIVKCANGAITTELVMNERTEIANEMERVKKREQTVRIPHVYKMLYL